MLTLATAVGRHELGRDWHILGPSFFCVSPHQFEPMDAGWKSCSLHGDKHGHGYPGIPSVDISIKCLLLFLVQSEAASLPSVGEVVYKKMLERLLSRRRTFLLTLSVLGNVVGIRSRFFRRWRNNLVLVANQVC